MIEKYFKNTREVMSESVGYIFVIFLFINSLIGLFTRGKSIFLDFLIAGSFALSVFGIMALITKISLIRDYKKKKRKF